MANAVVAKMVEWTIHFLRCELALSAGRPPLAPRVGARTPDWLTARTEGPRDPATVLWTVITAAPAGLFRRSGHAIGPGHPRIPCRGGQSGR